MHLRQYSDRCRFCQYSGVDQRKAEHGRRTQATGFTAVTVVQRSAQSDQVPVGKSGTVTATCQPGEQLLSGGYYVNAWEGAADVVASYPSRPDAWTVVDNNTSGPSYVQIFAYANCLQAPYSVGVRIVSQSFGSTSQATCPSGAVILGGGFQATGDIIASMPISNGWRGVLTGVPVRVFALCATRHLRAAPATSIEFTTKTVFGPLQGGTAQCGSGQLVAGGGYTFEAGYTAVAANGLAPDAASWGVGVAGSYTPVRMTVWATCVIAPQS